MDLSQQALQTNEKFFFLKFNILVFEILDENRNIFKRITKHEYWLINLQCLIYKWIYLNELYKLMGFFFKFQIRFRIFGRKPKFFQKNREAWIFIKMQSIVYQWIRLNELYKTRESFFSN